MSIVIRTRKGVITSYREAWKAPDGVTPVWTWRCDKGEPPHDFGTVEAAEKFRAETHRLSTPKEIEEDGWTIEEIIP